VNTEIETMKITIQSIHFSADDKLTRLITKKLDRLRSFHDRIVDVEVFLKLEGESAHIKDKTVQIKVKIPQNTLISKETSKTFEESLDLAIDSLKTQLRRHKDRVTTHKPLNRK
jgi:putative sigma-54 modulation protein